MYCIVVRNILFSQGANPAAIVVFHVRRGVRAGPAIHARHLLAVADRGELAHFAQVIGWIVRAAGGGSLAAIIDSARAIWPERAIAIFQAFAIEFVGVFVDSQDTAPGQFQAMHINLHLVIMYGFSFTHAFYYAAR